MLDLPFKTRGQHGSSVHLSHSLAAVLDSGIHSPRHAIQISVAGLLSGLMSSVIDTAVGKAGDALRINGVTLSISSDAKKEAMAQARRAAVADALATAQLLASAAGVKLGAPMSIVDSNNGFSDAGNGTSCGEREWVQRLSSVG